MSPAELGADPDEPSHEGIGSPPPGSAKPAADWRPREPPLIAIDPAFVLDRWRPGDGATLRRLDLDTDTARFFGYTVEQAQALPDSHYDGDERARGSLRAWQEGTELNLAIRRRSDGQAAGWVELRPHGEHAEVSYNVTECQVLSWAFARSPGERSFAWARLASLCDSGLFFPDTGSSRTRFPGSPYRPGRLGSRPPT